jgi:Arc/MetJ-type ribon-helix-helix transcriptional regulator
MPKKKSNTKLMTILMPEVYLEGIDELVNNRFYPSRSSVIRSFVRDGLRKEVWERGKTR